MPELLVSKLGERKLLKKIFKRFIDSPSLLRVGMGDDAAVVQPRKGRDLVYTTDTLVEKIDFDLNYTTYDQIGQKAIAANLSDIAAMGATPRYYLLTLGIPGTTSVSDILKIFKGARRIAEKNKTYLIGGDLSESPSLFIGVAMIGEVKPFQAVLRRAASPGDILFVTGTLGDSRAGLEILQNRLSFSSFTPEMNFLVKRHLTPLPRIQEGQLLSQKGLATAMMDISDGLYTDILNLTEASGVGADIQLNELPLSGPLVRYQINQNKNPSLVALSGGEDFELLFTISPKNLKKMIRLISSGEINAKPIGKITEKKRVRYLDEHGKQQKVNSKGYEHFLSHKE